MGRFLRSHCKRLVRLLIPPCRIIHNTEENLAPNLDLLMLHGPLPKGDSSRILAFLGLNRNNLTKLDLHDGYLDEVSGLTLKDLEMPSLKQLRFSGNCSYKLIQSNADHLETLVFLNCSGIRSDEMDLPEEGLPKLTTLVRYG